MTRPGAARRPTTTVNKSGRVRRRSPARGCGDQLVLRVAELIAGEAPELRPRVEELPPGTEVYWVVVRARGRRTLCFCAGEQVWEGDLLRHVLGTAVTDFEGVMTELTSTTTDPALIAAAIVSAAARCPGPRARATRRIRNQPV